MKRKTTTAAREAAQEADGTVATALDAADTTAAANGEEDAEAEEGQVVDLITGEPVKLSAKEQVRQEEERKLLEEFGYPEARKEDLIRLDFRVKPQQGKPRRLPLVVLRPAANGASTKPEDRAYILIDIQPEKTRLDDPKSGSEALAELLRDTSNAEFAVWTNGTERIVWWKEAGRIKIRTKLISDIPRFGKGAEDCFTLDKQALRPAGGLSLRQAFQRCHDHIYANRGGSNEAVFWELLKVVFAKIQDERRLQQAAAAGQPEERLFRIASLEERNDEKKAEAVKQRLEQLYAEVRSTYPELFGSQTDEIDLSAQILSYVVAQLELYSFLESSVDVKGEAYEAIVGKNLQGTRGEFFTPRNAVKLGIRILDPKPGDKCIDPACGTGGFIVVIMNYIAEKLKRQMAAEGSDPDGKDNASYTRQLRLASQRIFGIDINPNLVRVARMNMVMNNDGQGGITHLNSLERSETWRFSPGMRRFYKENGSVAKEDFETFFRRELAEGTFDICATNPPFGTKIKIEGALLSQYELAHKWSYDRDRELWSPTPVLQTGVAPEILFIERCVRLLKPGTGKLCIVLPDGILGNPDDEYIRVWLLKQCEVLALVDMPVELFLPKVGTGRKRPYIEMVFRLSDTLNSVFSGSGDIQMGTLREAIDVCYKQQGFDRDNPESWKNEPPTLEMLEAVLGHMAADRGAQVKNLQVRLQPLFKSGIFRKKKAEFEFEDLFKKTTVILLTAGIKDLMLAASRFILEKVYSAMLMAGVSKKLRVMAVVDEAHKLCGDETVTALIKEARKYGMGIILSSQETRDFHPSVFANTGTLIGLALEEEDAGVMSKYMGLTDKTEKTQAKEMLLYQANGQALIRSQHFLPYSQIKIFSFEDRLQQFHQEADGTH